MATYEEREHNVRSEMDDSIRAWRQLVNDAIAAKTSLENTQREMDEILTEIKNEFNVKTIEEFRSLYETELQGNEKKVAEFKQILDQCQKAKEEVEVDCS